MVTTISAVLLGLAVALCWSAVKQLGVDLADGLCQTTFIRQGYKPLDLGHDVAAQFPSYRLFAYTGDSGAPPQGRELAVVPALFVHGHLGTHQQMRSLASETARELLRRYSSAGASMSYWLTWQAADFGEEMSALSGALLARQTGFVVACIKHLQAAHSSGSGGGRPMPLRLALVGYSMGGIVARAALQQLEADPSFDMSSVALLVTLGAPNRYFPSFAPSTAFRSALSQPQPGASAGQQAAAYLGPKGDLPAAWVPTLAISAGAGDLMVPELFSGLPPDGGGAAAGAWVQLSMQDVPGVWTSTGHKSIVSCNQLVRHLAPLLVDIAQLCSTPAGSAAGPTQEPGAHSASQPPVVWRQVLELLRRRMSTNVASSLLQETAASGRLLASRGAACSSGDSSTSLRQHRERHSSAGRATLMMGAGAGPSWVFQEVRPGAAVSLQWSSSQQRSLGHAGVMLLVSQAKPCRDFSIAVTVAAQEGLPAKGAGVEGEEGQQELAGTAQPLPPLLPGVLVQAGGPGRDRPWYEIIDGIDWLANATWIIFVPFPASDRNFSVQLTLAAPDSSPSSVLAQVLPSHPLTLSSHLPPPGAGPMLFPAGSPSVALYQPPPHIFFPRAARPPSASSRVAGPDLSLLASEVARLLLGAGLPLRLRVVAQPDSSPGSTELVVAGGQQACYLPAVIGLGVEGEGTSRPDVVKLGLVAVPLWRGDMAGRRLLLVTDPRCYHRLGVEWDVAAWLGFSLRQHAYALPSLCTALSMAALGSRHSRQPSGLASTPRSGLAGAVVAVSAVAAAWGSQHGSLIQRALGLAPWAALSAAEAAALFVVAGGVLTIARATARASLRLAALVTCWVGIEIKSRAAGKAVFVLWGLAAVGAACLHPSLALMAGVLRLWLSLAGAPAGWRCSRRSDSGSGSGGEGTSAAVSNGKARVAHVQRAAAAGGQQQCQRGVFCKATDDGNAGHSRQSTPHSASHDPGQAAWEQGVKWLLFHSFLALLAAPGLMAWLHSRHRAGLHGRLSTDAAVLLALGLHACWKAWQVDSRHLLGDGAQPMAAGGLLAVGAAVAGLWGYAGCSVAALVLCEEAWRVFKPGRQSSS